MRLLPLLVGVAFLVVAACWIAADAPHHGPYDDGSALSFGPTGLSQAHAYLRARHPDVGLLTRPLNAQVPTDLVVLRIQPALGAAPRPAHPAHGRHPAGPDHPPPPPGAGDAHPPPATPTPPGEDQGSPDHPTGAPGEDEDHDGSSTAPVVTPRHADAETGTNWDVLTPVEADWIDRGGRLVLGVGTFVAAGLATTAPADGATLAKTFPALPGVTRLAPSALRVLTGVALRDAVPVFTAGEGMVIGCIHRGHGELWLLSCSDCLDNRHLALADHLALLEGLVAGRRGIRFDELAHGVVDDQGVLGLLRHWGLGPALLLLGAGIVGWWWRAARLVGPPAPPLPPPRPEAVDAIAALGQLYARALDRRAALAAYEARLVRLIRQREHLREPDARRELERRAGHWRLDRLRGAIDAAAEARALDHLHRAARSLADERSRPGP